MCVMSLRHALLHAHGAYIAKKKDVKAKAKPKKKPQTPPPAAPSISAYRRVVTAEQEEDLMASIFNDMDTIAPEPVVSTRKRKPEPESYPPSLGKAKSRTGGYERSSRYGDGDTSSDGFADTAFPSEPPSEGEFDLDVFSPKKKLKTANDGVTPAIERMSNFHVGSSGDEGDVHMNGAEDSFDDLDMDAVMAIDDDELDDVPQKPFRSVKKEEPTEIKLRPQPTSKPDTKKSLDDTPAWLSVYDSLSVTTDDSLGPAPGSSSKSMPSGSKASVLEDDGSFRFFWLDYLEHEGRIHFVGKTQDKKTKAWVSCCVTVENLQRNLFVLPRERRVEQDEETGELYETDVTPTLTDVYGDFDRVRKKAGIKSWKAKFVKRRYAFGEKDITRGETQWLKVVYGFNGTYNPHRSFVALIPPIEPQIPNNVSSPNFSRVMGTSTSAFELLVLKRKIMGPCWLQIKKPEVEFKGVSPSCLCSTTTLTMCI